MFLSPIIRLFRIGSPSLLVNHGLYGHIRLIVGGSIDMISLPVPSYSSTCAKAAGYPVLLALKCMLVAFAANNKGHDGHWREKLEEEDTLLRKEINNLPLSGR